MVIARVVFWGAVGLAVVAWWWAAPRKEGQGAVAAPLIVGSHGTQPGEFFKPRAIALDAGGRFYVVDRSGRVQYFSADGTIERTWHLPDYENGQPVGLTVESEGSLLVCDSHYSRVLRYSRGGEEELARWGRWGTGPGELTWGRDVVVDSAGLIYVGDYGGGNDRIVKFASDGRYLASWGSAGDAPGQFQRPQGMCIERTPDAEYLLVADCSNHRVQRFTLDGELVRVIGAMGRGRGEFRYPMAVAVGPTGDLFVCEWGNNRIQRLSPEGECVGFWGGPGEEPGRLATPWDLEIDAGGTMYVVDYGNHRVQIFEWSDSASVESGRPAESQWTLPGLVDREPQGAVDLQSAAAILSGDREGVEAANDAVEDEDVEPEARVPEPVTPSPPASDGARSQVRTLEAGR